MIFAQRSLVHNIRSYPMMLDKLVQINRRLLFNHLGTPTSGHQQPIKEAARTVLTDKTFCNDMLVQIRYVRRGHSHETWNSHPLKRNHHQQHYPAKDSVPDNSGRRRCGCPHGFYNEQSSGHIRLLWFLLHTTNWSQSRSF
jgi:hypothetical protein